MDIADREWFTSLFR